MDLYEIYQLGLKLKYGVPLDKDITAEDMIKNHAFSVLSKEIKQLHPLEISKNVDAKN